MPKLNEILGDAFNQLPEDLQKQYGNIDLVDSAAYVLKKDYDELDKTVKQYKKDLGKRDQDLKELKEKTKDNEELNLEIQRLQEENKKVNEDHQVAIKKFKFDTALEKKLGEYKPKNLSILMKALDFEKISLDGENFLGLDDQMASLKESDPYLFGEEIKGGTGSIGGGVPLTDKTKGQLSLGARLAEQKKTVNQATENLNKFFN